MTTSSGYPSVAVRRAAYVALAVALVHIIFGAIVRISGSGMGCGDHWPKCYGAWFPPLERMDLVIEVMHRYLAVIIGMVTLALAGLAWANRNRGGASRSAMNSALLSLAIVIVTGAFGAVTVKFANAAWATVVHLLLAVSLLAALSMTVIRTGGFGAAALGGGGTTGTRKAVGGATSAAIGALLVVLLGGLTAKLPGAAVACAGFPLCGDGSLGGGAQHVQLTHRILAYLLVLHLLSLPILFRKRGEPVAVRRAATIAAVLGVLQVVWAGWMVLGGFPGVVRSLHQATGISIWLAAVSTTFLARVAHRGAPGASRAPGRSVGTAEPMAAPMRQPRPANG